MQILHIVHSIYRNQFTWNTYYYKHTRIYIDLKKENIKKLTSENSIKIQNYDLHRNIFLKYVLQFTHQSLIKRSK